MREFLLPVVQALYLFAPLVVSSALSGIVMRFDLLHALKRPVDGGATFRGARVFGDGKTWRGVVVAVVGCVAAVAIQKRVVGERVGDAAVVDYAQVNEFLIGAAMGLGATLGELPNSFVKRRLGIAAGKQTRGPLAAVFYVWDQVDLLTTTWPLLAFWVRPSLPLVAGSVVVAMSVHPAVSWVGWAIGARKSAR